jgi:sarcosine oxidase subunit alpha
MSQPNRLPADAAHEFGGIALDRSKPLSFKLNGRRIDGFFGDTVLSAALAAGIDTLGTFGDFPLGITDRLAPLAAHKGGDPLPIDRLPAASGLDLATIGRRKFSFGVSRNLGHIIDGVPEPPWLRQEPDTTLTTDLLIVGGGIAGLAAADAAAREGHKVILVDRRPWLGGDARYFGPVGDEASPAAATNDLIARIATEPGVTVMTHSEVFALHGTSARIHRIVDSRGTVIAVTANRIVLATGSMQRLPIFAGNRLPGITSAISAYHLAKRYGVVRGRSAVVATQSNYGYRLALRLNDAGVSVGRIVDPRVNPQSRFVDFAKASGLKLAGGQFTLAVTVARRHKLHASFANVGTVIASLALEADSLIVSGPFQPDLTLWMLAGGGTQWADGKLLASGHVEHVALAGSAAGYRSMGACILSGRAAVGLLFDTARMTIDDAEIGAPYETPEVPATIAPIVAGAPAYLDDGVSLIMRPDPTAKPRLTTHAQAPSLGDVAASVELELTRPADAGAVAEERSAPGGDLAASDWRPTAAPTDGTPAWLVGRFGDETTTVHLIVDNKRKFERGALVYANISPADPTLAIGVIKDEPDTTAPGGLAIVSSKALKSTDRFIVEAMDGPSPARIAEA